MNPHDAERHEEALPELLARAGNPRESFESSELARCSTCRALFEELEGLRSSLDEVGRDQRETLRATETDEASAAEERVEALSRPRMAGHETTTGGHGGPPSRRWLVGLLAAALILFAVTVILTSLPVTGPPDDPGTTLGEGIELLRPTGEVTSYPPFRWTGKLPEGGHFRIEIHDADDPTASPFLESPAWHETTWNPDPGERPWPPRIRWVVRTIDAAGESIAPARTGWASLSP
jgi:hypothetical protein